MGRLLRSWRVLRALSWRERRMAAGAAILLPLVAAGLRLFGFGRVQRWLLGRAPVPVGPDRLAEALAAARIVNGASAWSPLRVTCLARSLVLCRALRTLGLEATLRIGIRRPASRFAAHAWVEHRGAAVGEPGPESEGFSAFEKDVLQRGA